MVRSNSIYGRSRDVWRRLCSGGRPTGMSSTKGMNAGAIGHTHTQMIRNIKVKNKTPLRTSHNFAVPTIYSLRCEFLKGFHIRLSSVWGFFSVHVVVLLILHRMSCILHYSLWTKSNAVRARFATQMEQTTTRQIHPEEEKRIWRKSSQSTEWIARATLKAQFIDKFSIVSSNRLFVFISIRSFVGRLANIVHWSISHGGDLLGAFFST